MLIAQDVCKRVQFLLDDLDQSVYDDDYIMAGLPHEYDRIFNRLRANGYEFDQGLVELFNVPSGTPDLTPYLGPGQPLGTLINPTVLEWKLPGQLKIFYMPAQGPLNKERDIIPIPGIDSWAWRQQVIYLSSASVNLDLRITGEFLLSPLTDVNSVVGIAANIGVYLVEQMALTIGESRMPAPWVMARKEARDDAFDDINQGMARAMQSRTYRAGRMSGTWQAGSYTLR